MHTISFLWLWTEVPDSKPGFWGVIPASFCRWANSCRMCASRSAIGFNVPVATARASLQSWTSWSEWSWRPWMASFTSSSSISSVSVWMCPSTMVHSHGWIMSSDSVRAMSLSESFSTATRMLSELARLAKLPLDMLRPIPFPSSNMDICDTSHTVSGGLCPTSCLSCQKSILPPLSVQKRSFPPTITYPSIIPCMTSNSFDGCISFDFFLEGAASTPIRSDLDLWIDWFRSSPIFLSAESCSGSSRCCNFSQAVAAIFCRAASSSAAVSLRSNSSWAVNRCLRCIWNQSSPVPAGLYFMRGVKVWDAHSGFPFSTSTSPSDLSDLSERSSLVSCLMSSSPS
mmetsp:Transcript_34001/g.76587  ORF Transcript_34001/g.76587 Transcript_34001/m.76587 type:complete len:342 (+) Transcript_34001:908-1933(+)